MSKIDVQGEDEFLNALQGDELDGTPEEQDIPEHFMLMSSIEGDISRLRDHILTPSDAKELRALAEKLNELADKAERPF